VRRITREADGALAIDGAGETVDYLLEMRRFDESAVLGRPPSGGRRRWPSAGPHHRRLPRRRAAAARGG
jgi:hypothetical protein